MAEQNSVIITGASSGIGRACALVLARRGWRVFAGVRKLADGAALMEQNDSIIPLLLDVADSDSIARAAAQVAETVGSAGLQGLVNNAGIAVAAPIEFLPIDELRRQLEVNVVGQIAVTQAFLPLLRQGKGRIVMMSSVSGRGVSPMLGPYSASKFALEALSDALRMELLPSGIHVAIIEPASIRTPIWDKSLAAADERLTQMSPQAEQIYGTPMQNIRRIVEAGKDNGAPTSVVTRAVRHALTSPHPKTRYLVGTARARWQILANLLPDRVRDRLVVGILWRKN